MYYNLKRKKKQWIIHLKIWRIILNEIVISTTCQPVICGCDSLAVSEPFYHADRILDFNVLIYVVEGVVYVSEEGTDYEIGAGELLFLKKGVRHYGKRRFPAGLNGITHIFFWTVQRRNVRIFSRTPLLSGQTSLSPFSILYRKSFRDLKTDKSKKIFPSSWITVTAETVLSE